MSEKLRNKAAKKLAKQERAQRKAAKQAQQAKDIQGGVYPQ